MGLDGLNYLFEEFNAGVLDGGDLGDVVGVVQRTDVCPDRDGDASDLPVGTELRAADGVAPEVLIAAERRAVRLCTAPHRTRRMYHVS